MNDLQRERVERLLIQTATEAMDDVTFEQFLHMAADAYIEARQEALHGAERSAKAFRERMKS